MIFGIPVVQGTHRVVAVDMRGYNESEKPAGIDSYHMETLVEDLRWAPCRALELHPGA